LIFSLKVAGALVVLAVGWYALNFLLVWQASRLDQARKVQAIVVLGAAQYNGVPSPVLKSRLDHAFALWRAGDARVIVVTGGKEPGDRYTEGTASANYLARLGVPQGEILREVNGRNTWESLSSVAAFLGPRHIKRVLLVSDPFHDERIRLMAEQLGLHAWVSPTRTTPIRGRAELYHLLKESVEVSIGRVVGFHLLNWVGTRV
jgi:uncharacterized SAM-binding protein YcdF (DUF218 family)